MSFFARWLCLVVVSLLAACSSTPPVDQSPPPSTTQPIVQPSTNDVMFRALGLVGTPYRYGGNTPESGFDCSGLIGFVYRDALGVVLPRSTREMFAQDTPRVQKHALQTGDLVFFATGGARSVNHAGIYVGEGRFVHAPSSGGTVRLDRLEDRYWQNSYLEARRVAR